MPPSTVEHIGKVGSKGEIFPPKHIREELGLSTDQPILMTVYKGQLIIRRLHSLDELLNRPPKATISYHAWKKFRDQLSRDAET